MDKDFNKTFDTCPNCGSPERFCESLGNELKERGLARPEWNFRFDVKTGAAFDQARASLIPIGVSVPGYLIQTDICTQCGTLYTVSIKRIEAKTQLNQSKKYGGSNPFAN